MAKTRKRKKGEPVPNDEREMHYRRQRNGGELTPRQQRRMRKRAHRG